MPEIKRSATMKLDVNIELPMSPPIVVIGRDKDGEPICQLHISATGIMIAGPRGGALKGLYWDELIELAKQ